MSPIIGHL